MANVITDVLIQRIVLAVDQWVCSSLFGINNIMVHESREGEREQEKVQTVRLDGEEPAVTGSLVKFCARAATGGEAVEQWRRRWSFSSLAAPP
jgi:hypothetical protein